MSRPTSPSCVATLALVGSLEAMLGSSASAAVVYSYTYEPTTATSGSVYVTETLSNGSESLAGFGLDAAAFRVNRTIGSGAVLSDIRFNGAFDIGPPFNAKSVTATSGSLTEATNFTSPSVPFTNGRALLGTLLFVASGGSEATTFELTPFAPNGGYVATRDFLFLDAPSTRFTPLGVSQFVISVPEPAALTAALSALVGLGRPRRRVD